LRYEIFALATSYSDLITMPENAKYYLAHTTMFEQELGRYVTAAHGFVSASQPRFAESTDLELREGIERILFEGVVMLEQAGAIRLDLQGAYGAYSTASDHTFPVYKAAEQMIYGRYSGLTHIDRAPFAPISVLRTAVELRLRRAFGLQSFLNPKNNGTKPIQLSDVFDVVLVYERQIQSAVDLHDVRRVYKWSKPTRRVRAIEGLGR